MAATRKLQGEEKVFPACLHLDIAVPAPTRGHRSGRPSGRSGRRALRSSSPVSRDPAANACVRTAPSRDARFERTVPGTRHFSRGQSSVVAQMATTGRHNTAQTPARACGLYSLCFACLPTIAVDPAPWATRRLFISSRHNL